MSITTSKELFINMKNVPKYNPKKHYFEQSKDVLDFYEEEKQKLLYGTNIGGYHVHPWLYWHINYFKTPLPVIENGRHKEKITNPPLDDNILYVTDTYKQAEEEDKGIMLFGCRGFSKSTLIASLTGWLGTTRENGTTSIIGGSDGDLNSISALLKTGMDNVAPAFHLPRMKADWKSLVEFGVREKDNTKHIYSRFDIRNADDKKSASSEKGAGLSPVGFILDEAGKFSFRKLLESALPSFTTEHGAKLVHLLSGCVCAGTKVWTNEGKLVNIEDMNKDEGILGYDVDNFKVSKEDITYWQPPHEKLCYRIETAAGRSLECSDDHPIFCRDTKINTYENGTGKRGRWMGFRETKDLKVKDLIGISSFMPFTGEKELWEPRFTGWLIGDGTYGYDKSTRLASCDDEVNDYITENFDHTVYKTYKTAEGKTYKETRIRGIRPHLTSIGIASQTGSDKTLPTDIHLYRHEDICQMLGGFYDADGYVVALSTAKSNNYQICLYSGHSSILEEVQLLLQRMGIHGRIHFKKDTRVRAIGNGKPFKSKGHYVLSIADKLSLVEFHKNISFSIGYKQAKVETIVEFLKDKGVRVSKEYTNMRFEQIKSIESIGMKPVYNLTAGTTHTYISNGIITHNTGGNSELSKDAKTVMQNPAEFKLLMLNRDRLDRSVPEEALTWKDDKEEHFCTFVPGQMSYRLDVPKVENKLSDYLGIKNKDLDKIKVRTTDWLKATKHILKERSLLKKDSSINKNKMYYPTKTDHCFLIDAVNPFPTAVIQKHLDKLESAGKIGKNVSIYRDGKDYKMEFSNKKRAEVSHGGGVADAPIILYGEIPEVIPPKFTYIGGHDGYKVDVSETDSLGSTYIIKRRNLTPNTPCETIVASLSTRPEKMRIFLQDSETMIKAFNAMTNMESIDVGLLHHLEAKGIHYDYLCPAFSFASKGSKAKHNGNSKFGLYPTAGNNIYRFNVLVDYCWEEFTVGFDEDNNPIIKYGVEFIEDIDLLKEILYYKPGVNVDRMTAFSHALVYARELDKDSIQPKRPKAPNTNAKEMAKRKALTRNRRYGSGGYKKY